MTQVPNPGTVVFDLDGCLCTQAGGSYADAQPIPDAIAVVNRLYDEGFAVLIYTARFMGRNRSDLHATYDEGFELTRRQLAGWGVRYHRLMMGKPPADVVVDDRAVFFRPDWNAIEEDIRRRLAQRGQDTP